jgi:hypothetical protein
LWLYSGYLITAANVSCGSLKKKYKGDSKIVNAYNWSVSAAVTTWVLFGLALLGFAVLIISLPFGGFEILMGVGLLDGIFLVKWGPIIVVFCLGGLLLVTGICSVMSSINIHASENYDSDNSDFKRAYNDSIIAACITLGTIGLLAGALVLHIVLKKRHQAHKLQQYSNAEANANYIPNE